MFQPRSARDIQLSRLITVEQGDVAVGYSRVSTEDQKRGTSHDKQETRNRAAAELLGIPVLEEQRDEQTGRTLKRLGLERILDLLESGHANVLLIFDLDRLSRKFTNYSGLVERLHKRGVKIYISTEQQFVSPNAKDRIGHDVKALISEAEWETIRGRMTDGAWRKINERQQIYGAGHPPYGYRWKGYKRDRELEIYTDEAEIVALIFRLYVYGDGRGPLSIPKIVHYLNDRHILPPDVKRKNVRERSQRGWNVNAVNRILRRAAYYGLFEHNQHSSTKDENGVRTQRKRDKSERVGVPCPAIIDQSLWDMAQAKLDAKDGPRNTKHEYLMARRLKCQCGYSITAGGGVPKTPLMQADGITPRKPKSPSYKCVGKQGKIHGVQPCNVPNVTRDDLDEAVWKWVKTHLTDPNWVGHELREERNHHSTEQQRLQEHIDTLLRERDCIEETLGGLFIDKNRHKQLAHIIERQIEHENDKLTRINTDLEGLQPLIREELTDDQIDAVQQWAARYQRAAEYATFAERRQFIDFMDVRGTILERTDGMYVKLTCRLRVENTVPIEQKSRNSGGKAGNNDGTIASQCDSALSTVSTRSRS